MNKTYHARVFGGKDSSWNGVDQGKHPLYPSALNMATNAVFDDNVFKVRDGQTKTTDEVSGEVITGTNTGTMITIGSGTDLFVGEIE
jgi:hypothetical protein